MEPLLLGLGKVLPRLAGEAIAALVIQAAQGRDTRVKVSCPDPPAALEVNCPEEQLASERECGRRVEELAREIARAAWSRGPVYEFGIGYLAFAAIVLLVLGVRIGFALSREKVHRGMSTADSGHDRAPATATRSCGMSGSCSLLRAAEPGSC